LRKEGTNQWRLFTADFSARAEASKVEQLVTRIEALRVEQFVLPEQRTDLDAFGLQNAEFQFGVAQGTNPVCTLQFGKSLTNDPSRVFARNAAQNVVVLVNCTNLAPWPTMPGLRDLHLLGGVGPLVGIEVHGRDNFSLLRETNDTWRVMPQNWVADNVSVKDLLRLLEQMEIVDFVKDVVPAQMLADHGLEHPALEYVLKPERRVREGTNEVIHLQFSTNRADKVMVRRSDEPSVYAVNGRAVQFLPSGSWQLRQRKIWKYPIEDLASVTIQQRGTNCQFVRKGDHQWAVAHGPTAKIEPLAVEETLLDLVDLTAALWVARGEQYLPSLGFTKDDQQITLEFKNAEKRTIQLNQNTPAGHGLAAVTLDGEMWVFAIAPSLRRDLMAHLSITPAL
jgi:hypothetical protein